MTEAPRVSDAEPDAMPPEGTAKEPESMEPSVDGDGGD